MEVGRGKQWDEAAGTSPPRRQDHRQERQEATKSGEETGAEEEEEDDEEGYRDGETQSGALIEVVRMGGDMPPLKGKRGYTRLHP